MRILFDFEIKFVEIDVWEDMSDFETEMFLSVKDFYTRQLMPLKEEIEAQEKVNNKCVLIIHIMDNPVRLSMQGYSKETQDRVNGCFSQSDFEYLTTKKIAFNQKWNN